MDRETPKIKEQLN